MTNPTLFENGKYYIVVYVAETIEVNGVPYHAFYAVTNKETKVVEMKTPGLVEAIFYAENSDRMLETQPWAWARQAEAITEAAATGLSN